MSRKIYLPALLVLAALAFIAAPSVPLAASDCGEGGDVLCSETQKCSGFLWWKKCSMPSGSYYQSL